MAAAVAGRRSRFEDTFQIGEPLPAKGQVAELLVQALVNHSVDPSRGADEMLLELRFSIFVQIAQKRSQVARRSAPEDPEAAAIDANLINALRFAPDRR